MENKNIKERYKIFKQSIDAFKKSLNDNPTSFKVETENGDITIDEKNASNSLCEIYDKVESYVEWFDDITESFFNIGKEFLLFLDPNMNVNNLSSNEIGNSIERQLNDLIIDNKYTQYAIRELKIVSLYIKQVSLYVQLFVFKITKKILEFIRNGKIVDVSINIINGLLSILKAVSSAIDVALGAIDVVIKSIGSLSIGLNLDGGKMSFFMSPKGIIKGVMSLVCGEDDDECDTCTNTKKEAYDAVNDVRNVINDANTALKTSYILGNVNEYYQTGAIPDKSDLTLNTIDSTSIIEQLTPLLMTMYLKQESLPLYERISPLNLGYMLWLNKNFMTTLYDSFGLPM